MAVEGDSETQPYAPKLESTRKEESAVIFGKDYEKPGFGLQRLGIDPVRFVAFNALAVAIALGANFLGMTSFIMSKTNPAFFQSVRADQLYSIDGYRRYYDTEDKYEFVFPSDWLQDQAVLMRNIQERDTPQALRAKRAAAVGATYPDVAFGPTRGSGRENLSVIKSRVMPGFQLREVLGPPREAAERLLSISIAPPGSNKVYELLDAYEDVRSGGAPAYVLEYTLRNDERKLFQHTVSVVMSRGTELYTFTATVPEQSWARYKAPMMAAAASFQVEPLSAPQGFY